LNEDGKEENINRNRRPALERIQEVCDRSRQRLVRTLRRDAKGKSKEVDLKAVVIIRVLAKDRQAEGAVPITAQAVRLSCYVF
jgi:hypothetical protein